jgi:hypothetical protein
MENEATNSKEAELREGLAMHTGSENCYRHWTGTMRFSDGVKFLADQAGAYWLIDNIAWSSMTAVVRREEFVLWKLQVHGDKSATLIAEDGNDHELVRQPVPWTDFPLEEISLYHSNSMLYLPSEH